MEKRNIDARLQEIGNGSVEFLWAEEHRYLFANPLKYRNVW
ncbi:hypothetical protein NYR55_04315 [Sphingomonas sp. BGYR3]|nr:hypothetical protein [Sphingomonas sp. BGYR3]MDG5487843.1 hypothetical protein [Sphingomonas sp. BGYR3]